MEASRSQQQSTSDTAAGPTRNSFDVFISADVETDGPIPGPYSMLTFALVVAGRFDGHRFERPPNLDDVFHAEIRPISDSFQADALRVNGLDRQRLVREGEAPELAMRSAAEWIRDRSGDGTPVLVAYPLAFDWTWLYWYFERFVPEGSPFKHSRCFDLKTAFSVKAGIPLSRSGRSNLPRALRSIRPHTHSAIDDAVEQAEIFANIFEWRP